MPSRWPPNEAARDGVRVLKRVVRDHVWLVVYCTPRRGRFCLDKIGVLFRIFVLFLVVQLEAMAVRLRRFD